MTVSTSSQTAQTKLPTTLRHYAFSKSSLHNQNQSGHRLQSRQASVTGLELRSLALATAQDNFDDESNELVFLFVFGFLIWHIHNVTYTPLCIHQHCKANTECIASTWSVPTTGLMFLTTGGFGICSHHGYNHAKRKAGQAWHVP